MYYAIGASFSFLHRESTDSLIWIERACTKSSDGTSFSMKLLYKIVHTPICAGTSFRLIIILCSTFGVMMCCLLPCIVYCCAECYK